MSEYAIILTAAATKQLAKIAKGNAQQAQKIRDAIATLAADPRPAGGKKLVGSGEYRIRVGDYRVLYTVNDGALTVVVFRAGHRQSVYGKR